MITFPGLSGAALLFWGWQTDLLVWAVPMALLLESSRFLTARWDFTLSDLKRVWNLCAVLFFGAGFILYSSEDTIRVPLKFTQWLPFPFYPMILAQAYGNMDKIPLSVFSWFLRRSPERPWAKKRLNVSYIYFGICLLAASATRETSALFYPGIVLLIIWALLSNRPRRIPAVAWVGLVGLVAVAGHHGHQQLHTLHGNLEGALARWFVGLFSRSVNIDESHTAIGRIGKISLSGRIVLRVQPEEGSAPPLLLRDASYDLFYRNGVWRNSQNDFTPVSLDTNDVAILLEPKPLNFSVEIASYLRGGRGQLALPHGTYEIQMNFPAALETNRMGIAKVQEGPGLLNLTALYGPGETGDSPPSPMDLDVPKPEQETLTQVVRALNLEGPQPLRKKLEAVGGFFRNNFDYSLEITRRHVDRSGGRTPIGQFLTQARSGHCEYFASATVLLLRQAGIPARYATGYIIDGGARDGRVHLVRERDAHAWAMVYREDKGIWEDFDTTPPAPNRGSDHQHSRWERVSDFFSNLKFQFAKWRWSKVSYTQYLAWLLVPLILFLVWRILSKRSRKNAGADGSPDGFEPVWPGADSEFYRFDQRMKALGFGRLPNELARHWQRRLTEISDEPEQLDRIFQRHYQLRFDPLGLSPEERLQLGEDIDASLKSFEAVKEKEKEQEAVAP